MYLIIEERTDRDELIWWIKYDITKPLDQTSLIPLYEPTALEISWIDDLADYQRRSVHGDAPFMNPIAAI
jgi:hypothetical protein